MSRCACGTCGGYSFRNNTSVQFRKKNCHRSGRRPWLGVGLIAAGVLLLLLCVPDYILVFGASAALIVIGKCLM